VQRLGSHPCVLCMCIRARAGFRSPKTANPNNSANPRLKRERPFYSFQSAFFAAHLMTFPGDSSNLPQDCALALQPAQPLETILVRTENFPSALFEDNFRVAPLLMMGLTNKRMKGKLPRQHTQQDRAQIQVYAAQIKFTQCNIGGWLYYLIRAGPTHVRARTYSSNNTLIIIVALRSGVCKVTAHRAVVNVGGL
jgi:hypothetical protein